MAIAYRNGWWPAGLPAYCPLSAARGLFVEGLSCAS